MDQTARDAVEAYRRLTETLRAAIADPGGYASALSTAAHETHASFEKAGLLDESGELTRSSEELFALVRELHPDWNRT
ncbi:hypothetical protein [Streptomyces qinglanensis]|uniref:hypothetical protein n=1 Tax=Streptomyces qinglanensis TaxID=943816 RepID=UPI003D702638